MFGEEKKGLRNLSLSSRVAVTAFLLLMGLSYIFGFLNIYVSHSPMDGKPGLSMEDIELTFYGSHKGTVLGKAINGGMKQYLATDKDKNTIQNWIDSGAKEKDFASTQAIIKNSCLACHSADAHTAGVVLETYKDVKSHLIQDNGMSYSRLIDLSHIHLFGVSTAVFLLMIVFSFTLFSEKLKIIIYSLSFIAVISDIGSWWLTKLSGELAFMVLFAGSLLGIIFGLLTLLPLYDMWIRKKAE